MSIIHEALKKTQKSMDAAHLPEKPIQSAPIKRAPVKETPHLERKVRVPHTPAASEANPFPWRLVGMGSILSLFLVATIGASSLLHFQPSFHAISAFAKNAAPSNQVRTEYAHNALQPISLASSHLILNGTMLEGRHRVAVINDQIYQIGDSVENKKITGISIDQVTLQDGKNVFELRGRA